MDSPTHSDASHAEHARDFAEYAAEKQTGLLAEFWEYLKCNKKWWLLPILFVLLGVGGLMLLTSSAPAVAPFLYTLF